MVTMSKLEDYLAFVQDHPELFVNPPGAGIRILLDEADIQQAESQMAHWLEVKAMPVECPRVGIAFKDQYAMILRDAVCFPTRSLGTYIRMVGKGTPGVIMFPIYQKQVLLIRHFRHATRTWHLEIPRGFGIKDLSSEESARRELQEEIEATISRLVPLGCVYPDTGMLSEYNDFFYADVESYGAAEVSEAIAEILPTPVPEFEHMLCENEITDGFTITAYTLAKVRGLLPS